MTGKGGGSSGVLQSLRHSTSYAAYAKPVPASKHVSLNRLSALLHLTCLDQQPGLDQPPSLDHLDEALQPRLQVNQLLQDAGHHHMPRAVSRGGA